MRVATKLNVKKSQDTDTNNFEGQWCFEPSSQPASYEYQRCIDPVQLPNTQELVKVHPAPVVGHHWVWQCDDWSRTHLYFEKNKRAYQHSRCPTVQSNVFWLPAGFRISVHRRHDDLSCWTAETVSRTSQSLCPHRALSHVVLCSQSREFCPKSQVQ